MVALCKKPPVWLAILTSYANRQKTNGRKGLPRFLHNCPVGMRVNFVVHSAGSSPYVPPVPAVGPLR